MIGSFCTTLLLHFSKRFDSANIHFSVKITLMILHFFYLPVSTFSAAATCSAAPLLYLPVFIYTPIKVKSELREEKKCLRQTEHPICQSLPMIQPVCSFGCKIFVSASCFQLTSVGENPAYFRTFATDRKQVDFGQEKEVFPLVLIQVKSAAKRTVFGLKNKRTRAFLPFKQQLIHFQAVCWAASSYNLFQQERSKQLTKQIFRQSKTLKKQLAENGKRVRVKVDYSRQPCLDYIQSEWH